jgi:hypothetical protein
MQQYKYLYTKRTAAKIRSFYKNVAKKYRHTYSYEDMERNVRDAFFAIYYIERTLPRRKPTLRLCFSNTTGTARPKVACRARTEDNIYISPTTATAVYGVRE